MTLNIMEQTCLFCWHWALYFDKVVTDLEEWCSAALLSGNKSPISDTLSK